MCYSGPHTPSPLRSLFQWLIRSKPSRNFLPLPTFLKPIHCWGLGTKTRNKQRYLTVRFLLCWRISLERCWMQESLFSVEHCCWVECVSCSPGPGQAGELGGSAVNAAICSALSQWEIPLKSRRFLHVLKGFAGLGFTKNGLWAHRMGLDQESCTPSSAKSWRMPLIHKW